MTPQGAPQKKSTVLVGVVIAVGVLSMLCCLGSVAAMVLPGYLKPKRAVQSEVKSNLKYAYTAERSYFGEKDEYADEIEKMGFLPERGNRYLYLVKPGGAVLMPGDPPGGAHGIVAADAVKYPGALPAAYLAAIPPALLAQAGVRGTCPDACSVTIVAVANLDSDADFDVWSISTENRTIGTETVSAGQPFMHLNDLDP